MSLHDLFDVDHGRFGLLWQEALEQFTPHNYKSYAFTCLCGQHMDGCSRTQLQRHLKSSLFCKTVRSNLFMERHKYSYFGSQMHPLPNVKMSDWLQIDLVLSFWAIKQSDMFRVPPAQDLIDAREAIIANPYNVKSAWFAPEWACIFKMQFSSAYQTSGDVLKDPTFVRYLFAIAADPVKQRAILAVTQLEKSWKSAQISVLDIARS